MDAMATMAMMAMTATMAAMIATTMQGQRLPSIRHF
jgi:hypothetical protein